VLPAGKDGTVIVFVENFWPVPPGTDTPPVEVYVAVPVPEHCARAATGSNNPLKAEANRPNFRSRDNPSGIAVPSVDDIVTS
jgi:hypothetical protein